MFDDEQEPSAYFSILLFLDGFSHLRENDHEVNEDDIDDAKLLKLLHSETDDEAENEETKA